MVSLGSNNAPPTREELQQMLLFSIFGELNFSDLVLQGGSALRLLYGSSRRSLDIDLTGPASLDLERILPALRPVQEKHVEMVGLQLSVSQPKIQYDWPQLLRFFFVYTGDILEKSVKIKVEITEVPVAERVNVQLEVKIPVRTLIYVPTESLDSFLATKVCAVAGRKYLAFRDLYDLWFIFHKEGRLKSKLVTTTFKKWQVELQSLSDRIEEVKQVKSEDFLERINLRLPHHAQIPLDVGEQMIGKSLEILREAGEILHGNL